MSLRYNVATLLREPIGSTREYEIDDRVLIEDGEPATHAVTGRVDLLRTLQGVLVAAHVRGAARKPCSRCLQDTELPLELRVEEEFFATAQVGTGGPLPRPDDPEAFLIDAHHTLDLAEANRQVWTTALPMQPLCRPDCKGLCPRCGKDLNQGACACVPQEDARWSSLRQLAGKLEGT
jgi:uncharacterized protein